MEPHTQAGTHTHECKEAWAVDDDTHTLTSRSDKHHYKQYLMLVLSQLQTDTHIFTSQ